MLSHIVGWSLGYTRPSQNKRTTKRTHGFDLRASSAFLDLSWDVALLCPVCAYVTVDEMDVPLSPHERQHRVQCYNALHGVTVERLTSFILEGFESQLCSWVLATHRPF